MSEMRIAIYEQLMEAQERIAQSRYRHGVSDDEVVAAMDAAQTVPSESERQDDLFFSALSAYVHALGGRLEVRAVFPEEAIVVRGGEE